MECIVLKQKQFEYSGVFIVLVEGKYKVLAYSGSNKMKLVQPQGGPQFEYFRDKEPKIIEAKDAVWFWSGPDNSPECPMTIIIKDEIQITCLKKQIYVFVGADDRFKGSFLGNQFAGNSWNVTQRFDIVPTKFICSKYWFNIDKTYPLIITAQNDQKFDAIKCSGSNYAGLIYGVIQENDTDCCLISQYYNSETCQCQSCTQISQFCSTCRDNHLCLTCYNGFYLKNNQCVSNCGDGILTKIEQCDDGNLNNLDGCSNSCTIQEYFYCTKEINQLTICKFNDTFKIFVQQVLKQFYENKITIVFKISPALNIFQHLNLSTILYSNFKNIQNISYKYFIQGLMFYQFSYNKSLELNLIDFFFNPTQISTQFSEMQIATITVKIVTTTNIPVICFSKNMYYLADIFQKWYSYLVYASLLVFIISSLSNQIIGQQLIKILNISYFSLGYIDKIHPLLTSILSNQYFNGYNVNFKFFSLRVPDRIRAIGYSDDITSNLNFMLVLAIFLIILSFGTNLLKSIFNKRLRNVFIEISKKITSQIIFMLLFLQSINFGFSFSLQVLYGEFNIQNCSIIILSIMVVIYSTLNFIFLNSKNKFQQSLKPNKQSQFYFLTTIFYLITMGTIIGFLNKTLIATFLTFSFSISFLAYHLSILPFKTSLFNYTTSINHLTICSILFIRMLYKHINYSTYSTSQNWIIYTSFIEFILLSLCVISSILCLLYQIFDRIRNFITKRQFNNIHKVNQWMQQLKQDKQ